MVAINYRLAPNHKFPAQVDDVREALLWTKANANRFSIDLNRLGLFGYSAGGHLSALVASLAETTMTRQELRKLAVGDIVTTDKDVGQPLTISINGAPAYRANLGRVDDQKAVQIVESMDQEGERGTSVP